MLLGQPVRSLCSAQLCCSFALAVELCFVELVQVDKEEVRLRRSIGMRKDEYYLDQKHITSVLSPFSLFSIFSSLECKVSAATFFCFLCFWSGLSCIFAIICCCVLCASYAVVESLPLQKDRSVEPAGECWFFPLQSVLHRTAGEGEDYLCLLWRQSMRKWSFLLYGVVEDHSSWYCLYCVASCRLCSWPQ